MKVIKLTLSILLVLNFLLVAQHKERNRKYEKKHKQIEELQKLRLLEILDLDEETAIKFFSRRNKYKKSVKTLLRERKSLIKTIEHSNRKNENLDDEQRMERIKKVFDLEMKTISLKKEYINSLSDILTYKQIEQVLTFEAIFNQEIKELLLRRAGKK